MGKLGNLRRLTLWVALIGAFALVAGVVEATRATPAEAVSPPSLRRVQSEVTSFTPATSRVVRANCRPGEHVVGGGGWAFDDGAGRVRLTVLQPVTGGTQDYYEASAEAPSGFTGPWWLQAYAICAPRAELDRLGYQIVRTPNPQPSTAAFREEIARCPGTKRVLGTGARITLSGRRVGLQLTRSSGPMDISRAQARADTGYGFSWTLTSYAVCVNSLPGQHPQTVLDNPSAHCLTIDGRPTYVHGAGGGTSGWLQEIYPHGNLREVEVSSTNSVKPLSHAVCAY